MIDKFLYKFFDGLDRLCEAIATKLSGPRCQCGKKKNDKKNYHSFNRITWYNTYGSQYVGSDHTRRTSGFSDDDPARADGS